MIIELELSPDQSRQINHLPAGRSFGEGQVVNGRLRAAGEAVGGARAGGQADGGAVAGGRIFTSTRDHLVPNPDPPAIMVAADLEGDGRFYTQLTDADPESVAIDMPVELTFRRIHEGDDYVNDFWKFRPVFDP